MTISLTLASRLFYLSLVAIVVGSDGYFDLILTLNCDMMDGYCELF